MFYTEYAPKWEKAAQEARVLDTELNVNIYEDAIVLPLRKRIEPKCNDFNGWHEGGVCARDYTFLAGLDRKYPRNDANWGCIKGYTPDKTLYRNETVIFGGILIDHFGHNLVDCLSRMWYFAKNPHTPHKFIFLLMTNHKNYVREFFELAGLTEDRYEIVTEPTQFHEVIIPEQAIYSLSSVAHPDWLLFFKMIKDNIQKSLPPSTIDKVYLTRSHLPFDKVFEVNERYFENLYSQQGYVIVAPEKLPLAQQINLIMNASSIATTMGTLSHMMLFASKSAECTIFLRTPYEIVRPQIIIDLLKGYRYAYIEITKEILPSPHSRGVPLFLPTDYFSQYLSARNSTYELRNNVEDNIAKLTYEYLQKYALNYRDPQAFKRIANFTAFDFLYHMNNALFDVKLNKKNYQKPVLLIENENLRKKNIKLEKELEENLIELAKLKSSTSWKITKPLRRLADKFRELKKKVKACLKN